MCSGSLSKAFPLLILFVLTVIFFIDTSAVYSQEVRKPALVIQKNTDDQSPRSFSVLGCTTWWSHDAVGYHPTMSLFLENISGRSITCDESSSSGSTSLNARLGGEIPFQGRFTDLHSGDVTVAREYRRAPILNHERFAIFLRGPRSYELPIDSNEWPSIECKAMCRINYASPEDLYIGHLSRVTMTDEDAQAQLIAQAGRNPLLIKTNRLANNGSSSLQLKETSDSVDNNDGQDPVLRSLGNTKDSANASAQKESKIANNKTKEENPSKYTLPKYIPGVGDDFYAFDKLYGGALEYQASGGRDDLTWTHYKSNGLVTDIFAGSRNAHKADVIIVVLVAQALIKDRDLINLGKMLARCSKSRIVTPFAHSVRYLSSGRSELMTTAIGENRIISFKFKDEDGNSTALVVSRLPGDVENSLTKYSQRVNFLKFIDAPIAGCN